MPTGVFELDGVSIASDPIFMEDCSFPIAVWNDCCDESDDVVKNLEMRLGWWSGGAKLPVLHSQKISIKTSTATGGDACNFVAPIASANSEKCELNAPKMKIISVRTPQWNVMERVDEFCRRRSINGNSQWCVFDQNGNLITYNSQGVNQLAIDFEKWNMQVAYTALISEAVRNFIHGDSANSNPVFLEDGKEIDGLYSQLLKGWDNTVGSECPDKWNVATTIDWGALVGKAVGSPTDKTIAGQTIALPNGSTCPVPEGLNLAEFFERVWLDRIVKQTNCKGGVNAWEMHVPEFMGRCLVEAATCIQPCGNCASFLNDPGLRDRFSSNVNDNIVQLYPSNRRLTLWESTALNGKNEIWFGPRSVGGRPSYVAFWDDMSRYFSGLPQLPGASRYGIAQNGYNPGNLLPKQELVSGKVATLEDRALFWEMKRSGLCLQGQFIGRVGILACNRHLWARFTNVACAGACVDACTPSVSIVP